MIFLTIGFRESIAVGWIDVFAWRFAAARFWIGVFVIRPMEAFDIHPSRIGANKGLIRSPGDEARTDRMMDLHWIFFHVTDPIVVVLIPTMCLIAIAKPL